MDNIYTNDELIQKIKDLDNAIVVVSTTGQSYTIDTGQSVQTVKYADLDKLINLRDYWEGLLSEQTSGNINYISTQNW